MASVTVSSTFSAEAEAQRLNEAMKGKGCNEGEIIKVITEHTTSQRELLALAYNKTYGKDLLKVFKAELKGKLEHALVGLMTPRKQYVVQEIRNAMKGMGTNEAALIDLLIPATNEDILEIKQLYKNFYGHELDNDISKEVKGAASNSFIAHLTADRDEGFDEERAASRAQDIKSAMSEAKWDGDTSCIWIFNKSSFEDIRKIAELIDELTGKYLEAIIREKAKGDFQKILVAIVQVSRSIPRYFADRLTDAMAGRGCDDKTFLRILILRAEIDILKITEAFQETYGRSLEEAIRSEIKGDLQTLALSLLK